MAASEAMCRTILLAQPDHAEALHLLGLLASGAGRHGLAADLVRRAIAISPEAEHYHNSLGLILTVTRQWDQARGSLREALRLKPDYALAHNNLGLVMAQQGGYEEAVVEYRVAIQCQPRLAEAHNNLGNALAEMEQLSAAIDAFREAIDSNPNYTPAYNNLGNAFRIQGCLDEAVAAFRAALRLEVGCAEFHNNLGNALKDQGMLEEAIGSYRRAVSLNPGLPSFQSNLLYALEFLETPNPGAIRSEQLRWNRRHANSGKQPIRPHDNDADPERRLKVGYVSPDFRDHPLAFFIVPTIEAHDRGKVEVCCYSTVRWRDSITTRLQQAADRWRDVAALSDAELANRIREDRIDVLVDLTMHSADNRLPVFARKPAPVQVSWLAYPGTTGLDAIDYRLTDARMEPAGAPESASLESAVRLPDSWCCYEAICTFPAVAELPALQTNRVTFGSLNQFSKCNAKMLRCWAQILLAVERSRLLLHCPSVERRKYVTQLFEEAGIGDDRIEFAGRCSWADYLHLFGRIDVCLDSFPCNGMTTTCHALWMGVPVVTLSGSAAVSRAGRSLLTAVGLEELVAGDEDEYVCIAKTLTGDLPRLARWRVTMRQRMRSSPLMDPPRFTRNLEDAYRAMWRNWCVNVTTPSW